ncbi:MAG: hypothetical protein GXP28_07590 [Planctomycetes bacterium]|nr:hypothetical protein [Planctomycetota bacterium]
MARRVKGHPYAVVLSFVATVALPTVTIAFSLVPLLIAFIVSGMIVVGLIRFLASEPDRKSLPQSPVQIADIPVVENQKSTAEEVRAAVRKWMLHHFGDTARFEHYYERANAANQYDAMYREAIESLLDDATWGHLAHGAQEWVAIGFETLVNWRSNWNNTGTKNELYRAVVDSMISEELNLRESVGFAEHVKAMVAARRLDGG